MIVYINVAKQRVKNGTSHLQVSTKLGNLGSTEIKKLPDNDQKSESAAQPTGAFGELGNTGKISTDVKAGGESKKTADDEKKGDESKLQRAADKNKEAPVKKDEEDAEPKKPLVSGDNNKADELPRVKPLDDEKNSPGSFMTYFIVIAVIVIILYLIVHNKKKLMAYIVEGRNTGRGRRQRPTSGTEYKPLKNGDEGNGSLRESA